MSNQKLYNKYRFTKLKDIIGNPPYLTKIKSDITENNIDHNYLLYSDTQGTGKTSLARIIAKAIPDAYIEEINASVTNGADKGKELAKTAYDIPLTYSNKVIIINEPMRATGNFFDALLEVFEEAGEHVYWIITTTELKKIPANVKSRFTTIKITAPDTLFLKPYLTDIAHREHIGVDNTIITKICRKNSNIPRDCLSDLELLKGIESKDEQLILLNEEKVKSLSGYDLAVALTNKQSWGKISKILKEYKENEVEGIRRVVCNYMKKVLLDNGDERISDILNSFSRPFEEPGLANLVLACYDSCK